MNTRRLQQVLTCLLLVAAPRLAEAQVGGDVTVGYGGLPTRSGKGVETGVQISDGVLMHTGIGTEIGYDSNVYYSDKDDPDGVTASPILRVLPFIELTNATRSGAAPSGVYFDLNLAMTYREYLSDVQQPNKRAFVPALSGLVEFSSNQTLSLSLADTFIRLEDPPYRAGDPPITRNMNMAAAQLRWAPGGGRLQGILRYTNTYDNFETSSLALYDSLGHELMLDLSWRWLPKTAIFVRASQGYIYYLDSPQDKFSSYPLRVTLGLRGLVTRKLSVNVAAGYANAFYKAGPTTSGVLGSISASAELSYRPTVLNTLTLGYRHDFQNSVVGSFYYLDSVYGSFQQQIAGRVSATLSGRYEHRDFKLPANMAMDTLTRTDNFIQAGAAIDYHVRSWFYTGVGYSLMFNDSTGEATVAQRGANFIKHQIFGRIGVTY